MTNIALGDLVDTSPAQRPSKNIRLTGRHASIVGHSSEYAPALFDQVGGTENSALFDFLSDGPYLSLDDFLETAKQREADKVTLFYTILLNNGPEAGKPVGQFALMRIDPANRVLECGHILFAPSLQRTAAATEAMYLIACHVFEDLGYRRYEWKCNALNEPSTRAALRLGFSYEGLFRQHMFQKGRSRDTAWYSMLDGEWPARKQAFEGWLSKDNFDGDGKQKKRLEEFR